jgi:hypothetical protein
MTIEQLIDMTTELGVVAIYDKETGKVGFEGKKSAVAEAHKRTAQRREEVAALLRRQHGLPDPVEPADEIVRVMVAPSAVTLLDHQFSNYVGWTHRQGPYYEKTEAQLQAMRNSPYIEEGDELLPDFAKTLSIRKASGLLIAIDEKGALVNVPEFSPHRDKVAK